MAKRGLPAAALTLLLLAGCSVSSEPFDRSPSGTSAAGELVGVTWLLDEVDGQPVLENTYPSLTFDDQGGLAGSGGCNLYSGTFTVNGSQLQVDENLVSTLMGCDEAVMAQESSFLDALAKASSFTISDDTLVLSGGADTLSFSAQSQDLADTRWAVTAFNDGQQAVVSVLAGTAPLVEFASDGAVTARTGCNTGTGSFSTGEGTIAWQDMEFTETDCADPEGVMTQEAQLREALASATTYHVEANRLELRTADDQIAVQLVRM